MKMNTGADLKNWRKRNGLSVQEFANKANYSVGRIKHIEADDANLSKRIRTAIADINLELHPNDDNVIDSWRNLKSTGDFFIKLEVDKLATIIPSILDLNEINTITDKIKYLQFLNTVLSDINKIKEGSTCSDKASFENEYSPITIDIKRAAYNYKKH